MRGCGGCKGEGAHVRFCSAVHGTHAWMRYSWSQRADDLADSIGSNSPDDANVLYAMATRLRQQAREASYRFKENL